MYDPRTITAKVKDGNIVIEIPIDILKFTFENNPEWEEYSIKLDKFYNFEITDSKKMAKDLAYELLAEKNDSGETILYNALEEAFIQTVENGSEAVINPEDKRYDEEKKYESRKSKDSSIE